MLRFKLWRMQNRLTQAQAAEVLKLGESTLALLESGRMRPTPGQIDHLRATFGAEVHSIFDPVQERVGGVV
jgi:transcriptional regulator with XRE-family HTH domain